jgi:hypothetical protein
VEELALPRPSGYAKSFWDTLSLKMPPIRLGKEFENSLQNCSMMWLALNDFGLEDYRLPEP